LDGREKIYLTVQLFFYRDGEQFEDFVDKGSRIPSFVSQSSGTLQIFLKRFFEPPGKRVARSINERPDALTFS
jgi:hypothetical protein